MEENLILDKLVQFGLTRQEANIYLCLYQNGELTGYEVAKMTGISRSNVYGGLSDLTDKGAAFLVQGSSNRYVAASIEEFCDHKVKDLQNARTYLCEHIPEVKKSSTGYITVEGYTNIRSKMSFMLEHTGQRVYIAVCECPGRRAFSSRKASDQDCVDHRWRTEFHRAERTRHFISK